MLVRGYTIDNTIGLSGRMLPLMYGAGVHVHVFPLMPIQIPKTTPVHPFHLQRVGAV